MIKMIDALVAILAMHRFDAHLSIAHPALFRLSFGGFAIQSGVARINQHGHVSIIGRGGGEEKEYNRARNRRRNNQHGRAEKQNFHNEGRQKDPGGKLGFGVRPSQPIQSSGAIQTVHCFVCLLRILSAAARKGASKRLVVDEGRVALCSSLLAARVIFHPLFFRGARRQSQEDRQARSDSWIVTEIVIRLS